jgi:hypothetical protein
VAYDGLHNAYIYEQNEESYTLSIYKVRTFLLEHQNYYITIIHDVYRDR